MKKLLYSILAAAAVAFSASSCTNDFLEEEMVATITQDFYETETGLDALVTGMYDHMRFMFHNETRAASLWEALNDTGSISDYPATSFSRTGTGMINIEQVAMWYQNSPYYQRWGVYPCYNDALAAIEIIDNQFEEVGGKYLEEAYRNQQKAVAMFAKDWMLYQLYSLMGDVFIPQVRTVSDNGVYYSPRSSAEDLYKMFIEDMEFAYQWLPAASKYSGSERNERITKGAAAFFLAHLYFDRAMGNKYADLRNADGSFKKGSNDALGMLYKGGVYEDDLESAIDWAEAVIDDADYELEDDFGVFGENFSGDYSDEESKEIVWAMGASPAYEGEGNNNGAWGWRLTCYYSRYTNGQWGLKNDIWKYGRHYGKTGISDWGFELFNDKINDARYAETFYLDLYPHNPPQGRNDVVFVSDNDSSNGAAVWLKTQNPFKQAKVNALREAGNEAEAAALENEYVEWFNEERASKTFFGPNSPYNERLEAVTDGANYTSTTDKKIKGGEPGLVMIANDREHAMDSDLAHSMPFIVAPFWHYYENPDDADDKRYYNGQFSYTSMAGNEQQGVGKGNTVAGRPFIKKYLDPDRLTVRAETSGRNLTVFRLADMYLLRAWANGLLGNWDLAIDDINELRERAAWNVGEERPMAISQFADYYNHGDDLTATEKQWPYTVEENTFDRIKVSADYWTPGTPEFEAEKYPHFVTADLRDRDGNSVDAYNLVGGFDDETDFYFSNFMLNEYCRELLGEPVMLHIQQMAGLRYTRLMWHSQRASTINVDENGDSIWPEPTYNRVTDKQFHNGKSQGFLKPHNIWQPIPVGYMDKLTDENGLPLSQDMIDAYQNPGYVD